MRLGCKFTVPTLSFDSLPSFYVIKGIELLLEKYCVCTMKKKVKEIEDEVISHLTLTKLG